MLRIITKFNLTRTAMSASQFDLNAFAGALCPSTDDLVSLILTSNTPGTQDEGRKKKTEVKKR